MKALVKSKAGARPLARGRAGAQDRHQRRADPGRNAPASAAPTCTSTTGTPGRRRRSPCRWSSATSSSARSSRSAPTSPTSTPARSSAAKGTSSAAAAATAWPAAGTCARTRKGVGVNRPGAFAEYIALPMTNVWHHDAGIDRDVAAIFDPFGNAVHTALSFPVLGEDVLITGAGPIGIMAAAVVAPRRRALRRHHRRQPLPPRTGPQDGRDRCAVDVRDGSARRRAEAARHEGRLRRRPGDVGQPAGLPRHARQHVPRRQDRHARHPRRARWPSTGTRSIFNMLTIKGIYGREMYETWYKMTVMLQSGLDITPGHHAPLPLHASSSRAST